MTWTDVNTSEISSKTYLVKLANTEGCWSCGSAVTPSTICVATSTSGTSALVTRWQQLQLFTVVTTLAGWSAAFLCLSRTSGQPSVVCIGATCVLKEVDATSCTRTPTPAARTPACLSTGHPGDTEAKDRPDLAKDLLALLAENLAQDHQGHRDRTKGLNLLHRQGRLTEPSHQTLINIHRKDLPLTDLTDQENIAVHQDLVTFEACGQDLSLQDRLKLENIPDQTRTDATGSDPLRQALAAASEPRRRLLKKRNRRQSHGENRGITSHLPGNSLVLDRQHLLTKNFLRHHLLIT